MQDDDRPHKYNRPDQHSKRSYARSSNEQPGRSSNEQPGQSSKDQSEQTGDKRKFMKIKEPMSPESIRKAARKVQDSCPEISDWHDVLEYPKLFQYYRGERCLYAEKLLDDLIIKPTYYAPILQVKEYGNLKYERVAEYNSRWLTKNKAR